MSSEKGSSRGLVKGSFIYGIGNIGTLAINFFLVPLYTFYLSNEELGYFDLAASAVVLLAPIFFGHIELAVLRWVLADKEKNNVVQVVSSCFVIFLIGLTIFALVFWIVNTFTSIVLLPYIFIYLISNFFYILAKQVVRSVYTSLHYVLSELFYILVVLVFSLVFVSELGLRAIFLSYGFASLSFLIYLLILRITKYVDFASVRIETTRELLSYSFPLVLNAVSLWMNNQSSKYLIASFLSLSANGIYAIAFKIAYVIQILNRIFYYSFQDKMFAVYGKENFKEYFSKVFNTYTALLFALLYGLIAIQRVVLPYIIDSNFLNATRYIPILALGVVFMSLSSILGIIYQCEKKNMHAFKTSLVSGILIVIMGFLIIPKYELYGASMVFAFGNLIWLTYRYFDVQRFVKIKILAMKFFIYIVVAGCIYALSAKEGLVATSAALCLAVLFSFYFNRIIVSQSVNKILRKIGN